MDGPAGVRHSASKDLRPQREAPLLQLQPSTAVRDNTSTNPITFPMADPSLTPDVHVNASAGHLSVHFEGDHPVDIPFLFEQREKRIAPAFLGSLASHIGFGLLAVLLVRYSSSTTTVAGPSRFGGVLQVMAWPLASTVEMKNMSRRSMNCRSTGLAVVIAVSLTVIGCATQPPASASEDRIWREQRERQQEGAREAGRIGYIGNDAPVGD
jgi:hypothetical protein